MVVSAVAIIALHAATLWQHWLFVLEATLIILFAAFWVVQTVELWDEGLRRAPPPDPVPA